MLPKGLLKEYSRALTLMMRLLDACTILIAGWVAYVVRFNQITIEPAYLIAMALAVLLSLVVFSSFNIYVSVRGESFFSHLFKIIQALCVIALILAGLSFFTKTGSEFSRYWFLLWFVFSITLLLILRCSILTALRIMRSQGMNERRVVIFGAGELGAKFAGSVQQALWTGFRIVTFIDDHAENLVKTLHGIPIISTPQNLSHYLSQESIDEIWLALPLRAEARVKTILHELRNHTITTRFVLNIFSIDLLNHSITDIAGFPVLNIRSTPMVGINRLVKAIEDRVIAAVILFIISPLLIIIAVGVKLSSNGPVFFKQKRLGWDGKVFSVYKFRTMHQHTEKVGTITQAKPDDNRVTNFGSFLRRTSLDELPQFLNVLQGHMSIVGPRPHALAHHEYYKNVIHSYMERHRVKPGITGWAQINGWRGETDTITKMEKRIEYDLYYINNWSLTFDLKIICLTLYRGFFNENAY